MKKVLDTTTPHVFVNPLSVQRSFVPLGRFVDTPMDGGVLPREYDLYAIIHPTANELSDVKIGVRFGASLNDKMSDDLSRINNSGVHTPMDEVAKRAIKHLFFTRKK
jgi:hypothetical protein